MKKIIIPFEHSIYAMDKNNPPAMRVPNKSELVFETNDCFYGQIVSEEQSIDSLDWAKINPATGPVFIEGAEPGDALKVTIKDIELLDKGVMAAIPGVGIFGDEVTSSSIKVIKVENNKAYFSDKITLPINPMIGVIGTAPEGEGIPCGTPESHGGNMDCTEIKVGNTLYLPVFHEGGLLAMGDVHAAMGDGEIMGTGIEIPAKIHVHVEVVKNLKLVDPILETKDMFYVISSCKTIDEAIKRSAKIMRKIVEKKCNLDINNAGMLLSAAGSSEVCQVVDPLLTARFGMPKSIIGESL